jgi:tetratricopeptide (TPR) repeat protein
MAGLRYLDLDVLFGVSGAGYQALVTHSPAGDGQSVTFGPLLTDLELENFVLKVGRFRSRTRRVEAAPVAAAKQVGGRLFEAVFAGVTGECLRRSLDRAREEQATLRIRLRVSECPGLADLPWELLYDRADDWFLALSDRTPVIRYVQLPDPPRPVPVTLPLRILLIRSEPGDHPSLGLDAEWEQVSQALDELSDARKVQFTELASATLGELRRALLRDTFHVLHYMGHGGFDAERNGVLLFTDRAGHGLPVTSGDLGVLLHDHTSLRLAVLNACEAGRTDPTDPFAGVADTLVRCGIPAVIAMQFEVSDDAAIEFAPALYGALAAGRPVDAAVAEARRAIYTVSPLEWATPVLYLRADDALLFDITSHMAQATSTALARAMQADTLCHQGRYASAETEYRIALTQDPRLARAHAGLAIVLSELRRDGEAETSSREAIRLDPTLAIAHAALGGALCERLKRYPEAETACREAIRLDPACTWAHNYLGTVLRNTERYPEAEAEYREAIHLDPTLAVTHTNLGFLLFTTKRYPEAEAAHREAIRLNPALAEAHANLGAVLRETKRYPKAVAAYREAIRLDPAGVSAYRLLGYTLYQAKRYPDAEAVYREAIRLDPADAWTHEWLGIILYQQRRYPEAEAAHREAIRLDPASASAHQKLGQALEVVHRYPEAEAEYREAIRLYPASASAHNDLGDVLRKTKRYPEAETAYREAIQLNPALTTARRNLEDIRKAQKR